MNLPSVLISLALACLVGVIVWSMIRKKKKGEGACGCGCSACAMKDTCHSQKK